jgi:uracil-DNA glycosylase family 4
MEHTTIPRFHEALRECRLCLDAGYRITPGPVFSSGPEPRVMLIGQAPGITEGQVKRPFNAGSGRRLFQWLGKAGWDEAAFRARHYMTAVTKCYPGPSGNGKGDRVPSPAEQALCRPWLEEELRLVNPRLIILVGGLAIKLVYPAKARLDEIIGTAAYFPPETQSGPLNLDFANAEIMTTADDRGPQSGTTSDDRSPTRHLVGRQESSFVTRHSQGLFIVPLPHPSGASLWPNKPENQVLIRRAVLLLGQMRATLGL